MPAHADASSAYVGISNLPNQRHKITARKGIHYNIMVVGNVFPIKTSVNLQETIKYLYIYTNYYSFLFSFDIYTYIYIYIIYIYCFCVFGYIITM